MKKLTALVTGIAGVALFAMMALTFADVFSRKFLTNSITGAVELTELMMTVMIFFALPLVSLGAEHIVFDLLDRTLPPAWVRWQQRIANAVAAGAFALAAWWVWERAARTVRLGDMTSALEIKLGPFHYMAALALALTALAHAWRAWRVADPAAGNSHGTPHGAAEGAPR
jgi:TRAP-type C4-dicarboxylate transport system permease small subunit